LLKSTALGEDQRRTIEKLLGEEEAKYREPFGGNAASRRDELVLERVEVDLLFTSDVGSARTCLVLDNNFQELAVTCTCGPHLQSGNRLDFAQVFAFLVTEIQLDQEYGGPRFTDRASNRKSDGVDGGSETS
jgi:hypothetical protein